MLVHEAEHDQLHEEGVEGVEQLRSATMARGSRGADSEREGGGGLMRCGRAEVG